jgi:hypothetical protein
MKKKEAMPASPLVVPVEAAPSLRFYRYMIVIFFLTKSSFCKDLSLKFNEILYLFTILLLYV